jgi:hypothetical protein
MFRNVGVLILLLCLSVFSVATAAAARPVKDRTVKEHPVKDQKEAETDRPGWCRTNGLLADHKCTPGAVFSVRDGNICQPGWASQHRQVTSARKELVYAMYGIVHPKPGTYVIDHLIPLELGGSNEVQNLWPQPKNSSIVKDKDEDGWHSAYCAGFVSLQVAQNHFRIAWTD